MKKQRTVKRERTEATVSRVYFVPKPVTHHLSEEPTLSASSHSGDASDFIRILKRVSRRISEPES